MADKKVTFELPLETDRLIELIAVRRAVDEGRRFHRREVVIEAIDAYADSLGIDPDSEEGKA